jgi:peptidoglycan/LPS O-acetylase OafA/YrhL
MRTRSTLIDTLKIVASQLIVWHHLSAYSPMAHLLETSWPTLFGLLFDGGRMVVQCFLVISGFLAAQATLKGREASLLQSIWARYLRLAPQFAVALLLVLGVMAWTKSFFHPDWVSNMPTLWEFVAHVLMLQGVEGVPAISAGAWYVAIDFQLSVSFALLLWLLPREVSGRPRPVVVLCVAALTAASWWGFNRMASLDVWALYFWGAYGLGVLAGWRRASAWAQSMLAVLLMAMAVDALLDFRARPVLAAFTAMALALFSERDVLPARLRSAWRILSDATYPVFLVHFAVILCFSALWSVSPWQSQAWAGFFLLLTWAASLGVGIVFNLWVKVPKGWHHMGQAPLPQRPPDLQRGDTSLT